MQILLSYTWMVVPALFAPFVLLAPHLVDADKVEAAATQGLINGWVLGMVMGALPYVLRTWRDKAPAPDGSWVSVIALNAGVGLVWATVGVEHPVAVQALTIGGYGLVAVAWIPFLRRLWSLVTAAA